MYEALTFLLEIFILDLALNYIDKVSILMGINCAPFVADLFFFCYERDFMSFLSGDNQSVGIEAFLFYFSLS